MKGDNQDKNPRVHGVKAAFTIHIIQDAHFTIKLNEVKHKRTHDDTIFVKPMK